MSAEETYAETQERKAREKAEYRAWFDALTEGDEVGFLAQDYGQTATIAKITRFTPTLVIVEENQRFRRHPDRAGWPVGGSGLQSHHRLRRVDDPTILVGLIKVTTRNMIRDTENSIMNFKRRQNQDDPLELAHGLRDIAVAASVRIRLLRGKIDEQHAERQK